MRGCTVTNVVRLFVQKKVETGVSASETGTAAAVNSILASSANLGHTVKELSKHFASIENAVDQIDDAEIRIQLKLSIKQNQEVLSKAILSISQHISKLPRTLISEA
jgi:hypothetical protein